MCPDSIERKIMHKILQNCKKEHYGIESPCVPRHIGGSIRS
jgi:hypothetical protein